MTTGKALNGKPYAGNPHVRFDEGEVAPAATPRRGSLLYIKRFVQMAAMGIAWGLAFSAPGADTWYVDDDKYGASGNGESLATAWHDPGGRRARQRRRHGARGAGHI